MYSIIANTIIAIFFMILSYIAFDYCFSIPEVRVSYSTGECVKVISENNKYNCFNKPGRYITIWVE